MVRSKTITPQQRFTYNKVDIFGIRVSLKFESKLVEVVYSHLRLVNTSCDCMVAILGYFNPVTGFWEFKVLYEVYCALKLFAYGPFSLSLYGALAGKPVWEGRGRSSTCSRAIYGVDLDVFPSVGGHYFGVWTGRKEGLMRLVMRLDRKNRANAVYEAMRGSLLVPWRSRGGDRWWTLIRLKICARRFSVSRATTTDEYIKPVSVRRHTLSLLPHPDP